MKPMKPMSPMEPMKPMAPMTPMTMTEPWWPGDLGTPSTSGAQNGLRYAFFHGERRLVVDREGQLTVYDTGDHDIGGVAQADSGARTVKFMSQHGEVRLDDLPVVP